MFKKCKINGANTGSAFSSAKFFFTILDKITAHRVTKYYPVSRINTTDKSYFMFFLI